MDVNLEFRWAEPDDLVAIQDFLSHTFGADSIQAVSGRCRWLYFENPLGLHVTLCLASGTIVAVCGHLPQTVLMQGREILAGFGIDFMVTPEWRRKGIGRRFLEMRLERFPLSLSIGQSKEMGALYRSQEACDMGPMYVGIFRRRPSIGLNPKTVARDFLAWAKGRSGLRIKEGTSVVPGELKDLIPPHTEWLRWRYATPSPYGDYVGLGLNIPGHPSGVAVCRSTTSHDLIVGIQNSPAARRESLAAIARNSVNLETRILFTGQKLGEDCRKAGFLIRPHGARLIGMTKDKELRNSLKIGAIDLTSGAADGDLLRFPSRTT